MGMGLRFEQGRHCDNGICAVAQWDLVKIWAGKWPSIKFRGKLVTTSYPLKSGELQKALTQRTDRMPIFLSINCTIEDTKP